MPVRDAAGSEAGQRASSHASSNQSRVRGTQSLVHTLGYCWSRPSLTALEVAWRWLFGAPALALMYYEVAKILASVPLDSTGIYGFSLQDPWKAAVILSDTEAVLLPPVKAVAIWLLPLLGLGWAIASGVGRSVVLRRYDPSLRFAPVSLTLLQLLRIATLAAVFAGWYRSIQWAAGRTISSMGSAPGANGEPNLVSYFAWVICLSLGIFTLWSLASWVLSIAPLLVVLEGIGPMRALARSVRLGKMMTGKLAEVNLVMGIVKLMLIVLAMVFSATPLPFATVVSGGALYLWWGIVTLLYFVANDFFQVARMVSFIQFWGLAARADEGLAVQADTPSAPQ